MFTGLIQDLGEVVGMSLTGRGASISIGTSLVSQIAEGDSVAVNGVCLTATEVGPTSFRVDVMKQTLAITAMAEPGSRLNIELAMQASDRLGGHIVQGHVDGVGQVVSVRDEGLARRVRVELPRQLLRYVVPQGSITLNGVSLTVADLGDSWAEVSLIPETLERTNLGEAQPGSKLNVECDIVAKYVERLVAPFAGKEQA